MQFTMYSQRTDHNTDRNSCTSKPNKLNTPETETLSNALHYLYNIHKFYIHIYAVVAPGPSQKLVISD